MSAEEQGEWPEYQKLVLSELKDLKEGQKSLDTKVNILDKKLGVLEVKAGFWGALAGIIPTSIFLAARHLSGSKD